MVKIYETINMKTTTFNLKSFKKKAYYEDAKGLMQTQSRSWMNCYKIKVSGGIGAQEAITSCMSEYQTLAKGDWAFKYASVKSPK